MLVFACLPLLAGGITTSIEAGMAFLDWPLSDGSLNPEGWMEDPHQAAEHSHRLLAKALGLLSIGLVVWTQLSEPRRWVRILAIALLSAIIFQGLLGGLRVLLDNLNTGTEHNLFAQTFAVMHALMAQGVIMLLVSITLATSRSWIRGQAGLDAPVSQSTRWWGLAAVAALLIQVLLGAMMRHGHAALAIPTFPLTPEGSLIPSFWTFGITVNFAHRAWAVALTVILMVFLSRLWNNPQLRRSWGWLMVGVTFTLVLQIYLGALTIWTLKNPHAATAHTLIGYSLIAGTYALTFVCFRLSTNTLSLKQEPGDPQIAQPAGTAS